MSKLQRALSTFEMSTKWIESGFLKEELCVKLLAEWDKGEDDNTEHYRYAFYRSILNGSELNEVEFQSYLQLAETEIETVLYASPLIDLIKYRNLTLKQKKSLLEMSDNFPAPAKKTVEKWLKT